MQLGLGTAQFGSAYGITNTHGRVPDSDVRPLLEIAESMGIQVLDTAAAYGAGTSESALGRALPKNHAFRIVTKTAPIDSERMDPAELAQVADHFERSLEHLRTPSVYGLLVHHAQELLRPGGARLAELLRDLRRQGLASRIGFSCYTVAELEAASAVLVPDLVQIPCSVLDRRFVTSEALAALRKHGTEVHARSLFLQGLLLAPTRALPVTFSGYRKVFERVDAYALRHGLDRLQLALGFAKTCTEVDVALVGVTTLEELRAIGEAWRTQHPAALQYEDLGCDDEKLVNPSNWGSLAATRAAKSAR